jgi:iron complex transport system substrate-binding protein
MARKFILPAVILLSFSLSFVGKQLLDRPDQQKFSETGPGLSADPEPLTYQRIISMAPSITEVLFAIGLEDRIVGVTRYCDYPPEAKKKPQVGGFLDPNYEAILSLEPDLVVLLQEQVEARRYLEEMGLNTLLVDHRSVRGIINSIAAIGEACRAAGKAQELVNDLETRITRVHRKTSNLPRTRVMVAVGRNLNETSLGGIYISGRDGFYDQLLELAGGTNVYRQRTIALPAISAEGIQNLNPHVIVDIAPALGPIVREKEDLIRTWDFAVGVDAVKNHRVYIFDEGYGVRPGPRFILLLEQMARVLHPELEWD